MFEADVNGLIMSSPQIQLYGEEHYDSTWETIGLKYILNEKYNWFLPFGLLWQGKNMFF